MHMYNWTIEMVIKDASYYTTISDSIEKLVVRIALNIESEENTYLEDFLFKLNKEQQDAIYYHLKIVSKYNSMLEREYVESYADYLIKRDEARKELKKIIDSNEFDDFNYEAVIDNSNA